MKPEPRSWRTAGRAIATCALGAGAALAPMSAAATPYVPADDASDFRGIGIRIEDDVLVTTMSNEVLTSAAPKDRREIEKLRRNAVSRADIAHITPALRLR